MKKIFMGIITVIAVLISGTAFSACGEHSHEWDEGKITVEATCESEGVKTFSCTVKGCKETRTESVGKTAHTWDGGSITKEPSCTDEGTVTFTCGVCGETRAEPVVKTAHTYGEGSLTLIPALTVGGEMTYSCTYCGNIKKEKVAPRDDFGENFYTSIADSSVWQYGYAEGFNAETGGFTFKRIVQTDEEQPAVWKAEGVAIERNKVYSQNNAVIAYPVNADMQLNLSVSFTGVAEDTRMGVYLSVVDADGKAGESIFIGGEAKDWNYETAEEIKVSAGGTLYLLFVNGGEGEPAGGFACRITSLCKHIWDGGKITVHASCTEYGEKTYTCNLCGESKTEVLAMTNHVFEGDFVETDGGHSRKCTNCGQTDPALSVPHRMEEDAEKRIPATCHSDGIKTMVCTDCGAVEKQAITQRPEHALGGWIEGAGGHFKRCENSDCGFESEIKAHNMQDGEIIKPPTATEKGEKQSVCSDCGYTVIIYIPTTDHTASAEYGKDGDYHWNICGAHTDCGEQVNKVPHEYAEITELREEPTCAQDGKSFWSCVCGAEKEETISKDTVAHDFENAEYIEDDGGHRPLCNVCKTAGERSEHTLDEGVITKEPTFWAEGVKTKTCTACGATATEAVARSNSASVDVNNEDWKFGTVDYKFGEETFTFNQITDKNANGDGFAKDGTEIKNDWFCGANFDTFVCIAFTFEEDTDATLFVSFKGIGGDDGILSDYSLRIGINGKGEWGGSGTEYKVDTVDKKLSFKAGDTVYFIFKHEKDGWDQGEYSITVNRSVTAEN